MNIGDIKTTSDVVRFLRDYIDWEGDNHMQALARRAIVVLCGSGASAEPTIVYAYEHRGHRDPVDAARDGLPYWVWDTGSKKGCIWGETRAVKPLAQMQERCLMALLAVPNAGAAETQVPDYYRGRTHRLPATVSVTRAHVLARQARDDAHLARLGEMGHSLEDRDEIALIRRRQEVRKASQRVGTEA